MAGGGHVEGGNYLPNGSLSRWDEAGDEVDDSLGGARAEFFLHSLTREAAVRAVVNFTRIR